MHKDFYRSQPVSLLVVIFLTGSFAFAAPSKEVNLLASRVHAETILQETLSPPEVVDWNVEQTTVYLEIIENNNQGSLTEIYRSRSRDTGYELIASFPWDEQDYTDANLRRRTTYYYRFRTVRDDQTSEYSESIAFTTFSENFLPTLAVRAINENTIELTFTDNSFNDLRYIFYSESPDKEFFEEFSMPDSGQTRVFTHHPVNPGTTYTYSVYVYANGDEQPAHGGGSVSVTTPGSPACAGIGSIEWEVWSEISGTDVSTIPVGEPPTQVRDLTIFETPNYFGNNYGSRIRGYVCVPQTGDYTFWISSDDNSELYLSTDDTPENKTKIASVTGHTSPRQWDKYASQQSGPITLEEGKRYFIEVLHKEGSGADHLAVGWRLPDGTMERPIPGIRIITFDDAPANRKVMVDITSPEDGATFQAPATITISADAHDPDNGPGRPSVEFWNGNKLLGVDSEEPFAFHWTNVPAGEYTIIAQARDAVAGEKDSVRITVISDACPGTGSIVREVWHNISGTDISSVPFNTPPDNTYTYTTFETPQYFSNNYESRMRGYVCVPSTGNYTFWLSSDDQSELWLSTDDNPSNAVLIASVTGHTAFRQWHKSATQESEPINLSANSRYYIEVRHKEGGGNDHISVGWALPNGTLERPIPGHRIVPFDGQPLTACSDDPDAGSVEREVWRNISGTSIASVPFHSEPDDVVTLISLETESYYANDYGSRIRGYFCIPTSGEYTFWIASDDNSELLLSTDADPANKVRIAMVNGHTAIREWDKYATQESMPISLEADQKYYFEVLHKEAGGNDHVAVGWRLPDGTLERPISGNRLIMYSEDATMLASALSDQQTARTARSLDEIRLFPNPATHRAVILSFISKDDQRYDQSHVDIISFSGEVVHSEIVQCEGDCSGTTLSLHNDIPPGVYLVKVRKGATLLTERLVIK